jgi:hypothetical protein
LFASPKHPSPPTSSSSNIRQLFLVSEAP